MSRSRPVEGPTISLFPFLAVLLCMMGALLVLLVLFSRSARLGDGESAAAARANREAEEELQLVRENLAWRVDQLKGVRDRTADDLARARLQLAGIEENSRALSDELERLGRLGESLSAAAQPLLAGADKIAALERKLKSSRESLDKARAEIASKPPAYAIVPYVGVNGTHRRPLYIECCVDGVFLQPEGIRLGPADFEGPPGPGNPLASALRAAREHIARGAAASGDPAVQPYPLLLVRPSGVMAYYTAREAIASWGTEFGYQLVDEDWTLTFPPRDATLAEVETRAVEESRRRLAWLAGVRPAKPVKPTRQYRAAPTRGGVVADGGPSVLGDQSRWNWTEEQAEGSAGGRSGAGTGNAGGQDGGAAPGRPVAAAGNGGPNAGGAGDGQEGGDILLGGGGVRAGGGRGMTGGGTGAGDRYGASSGFGQSASQVPGTAAAAQPGGQAAAGGTAGEGGPNDGPAGGSRTALAGGTAVGAAGGSAGASAAGAPGGAPGGAPDGGAAAGSGDSTAAGGTAGGGGQQASTGSSGAGGGGQAMPGLMQVGASGQTGGSASGGAAVSVAQARGKNWASLATQDRPIPLTRPIQLECALHEFRILDDAGRRVVTRIPLDGETATAIDPLVKAIHVRVADWGLAGDRMYWKPQLVLSETADGRSRREDLERLLADSGLDTRRNGDGDEIRNLPPVERRTAMISKPPFSTDPTP
jgi:hypothetical protein